MPINSRFWQNLMQAWGEDDGTTALEYALIVSLISVAIGFIIPELREQISELMLRTSSALTAAASSPAP